MCGIGGWIGHQDNPKGLATKLVKAMHHRGPDGQGIWITSQATLVHTRLSILDLSPAGTQPIANERVTVWCAFNGEIYNHGELRDRLQRIGHRFRGHSDSEVLPHLYEEEGPDFVKLIRGMFAIAIYDTRSMTLFLARDRFGVKPLFYAALRRSLVFASEINALRQVPGIDLTVDRQAVSDYAALLYIPAPETFYKGIRALDAGESLEACLNTDEVSWRVRRYKHWAIVPNFDLSLKQSVDRAEELITKAVQSQMQSDVPLGSLLSGGIDSSLVSVAAQQAADGQLHTFNVRFSEPEYDETWAALEVAKHIHSQHATLDMDENRGTWEHVSRLLLHAGQPFADTSLFAVNAVSRMMRRHVTVALSGDGGDEAFGGYNHFWQLERIEKLQRIPLGLLRIGSRIMGHVKERGLIKLHLAQRLNELAGADDVGIIEVLFSWIRESELSTLCIDHDKREPIRRLFEPKWQHMLPRGVCRVERLSALATEVNVRLQLANDYLFKVDMASMKEGLEVRVPMLDEDLMAFGLTLPHRLKVRRKRGKRVLREVARRQLPSKVADKPKWGFGLPVDRWIESDCKAHIREKILGISSCLPEYFNQECYTALVDAFCGDRPYHGVSRQGLYQRIIMLLSVQLFLEQQNIPADG